MNHVTVKDESYQQKARRISEAFYDMLNSKSPNGEIFEGFIRDIYPGYLIAETRQGLYKHAYVEDDAGVIAFAAPVKVQETFVASSANESKIVSWLRSGLRLFDSQQTQKSTDSEFQALFTKDVELKVCSEEERTVGGLVLVAGEVDSQNDFWRPEDIRAVALKFMENYQVIDEMHTFIRVAVPVESVYFPTEEEGGQKTYKWYGGEVPAGAWWITVKVNDDDSWVAVKSGKFTGFSIFGVRKTMLQAASKSHTVAKAKDLRLMKGDEWDVVAVALVDKPAVKAAQYYVIKRDGLAGFIAERGKKNSPIINEQGGVAVEDTKTVAKKEGGETTPPKVETATKADVEGLNKALADLMVVVKSQSEVLTAIVTSLKGVATAEQVTLKVKESGETAEAVAKRVETLEAALKKMTRSSNALGVESAEKSDKHEESGKPSWVNTMGGPRK
ncbi:MAG: XkdF-like putative serine protease domain-containing protein [Dehalococcoidia bacterium]|nr:XkdF-like putative serine protease domain-containing protein [Dehalococcoidia bacterium]